MKQAKQQNKGNSGRPTKRYYDSDPDEPEYEDKYAEKSDPDDIPKRIMTTDLDRSYIHYTIPHRLNDNGTMECACKEVTRLLATATKP